MEHTFSLWLNLIEESRVLYGGGVLLGDGGLAGESGKKGILFIANCIVITLRKLEFFIGFVLGEVEFVLDVRHSR